MATLAVVRHDLQEQWDLLRAWLSELPDPASPAPSSLPGWSVGVLVAHLGRVLDSISALRPAGPDDGDPLTLAEYLATYAQAEPGYLDKVAHDLAEDIAGDPLTHLDRLAEAAFADVETLVGDAAADIPVLARRGPIWLGDFLVSRLIELVVHAEDLAPALPLPAPVDPTARTIVADALLDVARHRLGVALEVVDERAWIAAATGRTDWADAVARGAVRPLSPADGTPDLGPSLPLL